MHIHIYIHTFIPCFKSIKYKERKVRNGVGTLRQYIVFKIDMMYIIMRK